MEMLECKHSSMRENEDECTELDECACARECHDNEVMHERNQGCEPLREVDEEVVRMHGKPRL